MRKPILALVLVLIAGIGAEAQRGQSPLSRLRNALAPRPERVGIPLLADEKKWLGEDVVYIISDRERQVFLALDSHELRDKFITEFWHQRDPSPGTEENEFKEEHYRRIAYANDMYGARSFKDGWRSERGRIYIMFGGPQSKQTISATPGLKDIEVWFYEAPTKMRRVSAFFRVVFYKRSLGNDFQLYDPTVDGPEELVEGPHMIAPTREAALAYIKRTSGPELWEIAQSLVPSESLGMGFSGQSQILLNAIADYPNTAIDSTYADIFLRARGYVATNLTFKHIPLSFQAVPVYNQRREAFLHSAFQILPENLKAGRLASGRVYAALTVKTFVNDFETNANVLERADHLEYDFAEPGGELKPRPAAFEQVLPLVPGKFKVGWIIEDEVSGQFTWHNYTVEVAAPNALAAQVSVPLVAGAHLTLPAAEAANIRPFRVANVQYRLHPARQYNQGDDPCVFFEYLYPVAAGKPQVGDINFTILVQKPEVVATPGKPSTPPLEVARVTHNIPHDRLSAGGILSIHRPIPTTKLAPGEYEVVVKAEDSLGRGSDYNRARFTWRGSTPIVRPILKDLPSEPSQFGPAYAQERERQLRALARK